ncbi:Putrescine N-hydroxycinnamoyltransferase [Bertholletia excelsa]
MRVIKESSRVIKPIYEGTPPSTTHHIPLSVFDKVTYNTHIAVIYAYRPPTPPNRALELGLQKALSVYREWAGRLAKDDKGEIVILLNDEGVRFVEASVDGTLDQAMPLKPSPSLLSLHPSTKGVVELVQVQITRFTCGSMVVGFTAHHLVGDGQSASNFLVAWGQACRGVKINLRPFQNRNIFTPRNPQSLSLSIEVLNL